MLSSMPRESYTSSSSSSSVRRVEEEEEEGHEYLGDAYYARLTGAIFINAQSAPIEALAPSYLLYTRL